MRSSGTRTFRAVEDSKTEMQPVWEYSTDTYVAGGRSAEIVCIRPVVLIEAGHANRVVMWWFPKMSRPLPTEIYPRARSRGGRIVVVGVGNMRAIRDERLRIHVHTSTLRVRMQCMTRARA